MSIEVCTYEPGPDEMDTPENVGYVGFFDFVDEMVEAGYDQILCPECDHWHIWRKKAA